VWAGRGDGRRWVDTLEAPEYDAYDLSIKVPYDPKLSAKLLAARGSSKQKPAQITIQTTRGYKPKAAQMITPLVAMAGGNGDLASSLQNVEHLPQLTTAPPAARRRWEAASRFPRGPGRVRHREVSGSHPWRAPSRWR